MNSLAVIPSEAKRSRGCNAADGVREPRLSIPRNSPAVTRHGLSTSLRMTLNRALAIVFCLALGIGSFAIAQSDAEFAKTNQQFAQGHFKDAIAGYEGLVRTGQASANVFYDLGDAYFRTGDFGRAILNYERALALERHHPEATANLQIARDGAHALELPPNWPERYLQFATINQYSIAAAVAFWLAIFGMATLIFARRRSTTMIVISIGCLLVSGVAICSIYTLDR